jgi:2-polyprenyl-6-methoxyphenol hydroxylase and related FAD-dependent oxidoreductases
MHLENIAVVGAGIAGLTAALSFASKGVRCDIFEEAGELIEVGAGLQVSPNAARVLGKLGVLSELEAVWTEPERISLVSGTSLRLIAHVPAGRHARERWGAPYGVLHRATLQKILLSAVERNPLCTIRLGTPIRGSVVESLQAVTGIPYPLIVGSDGVWSNVRASVPQGPDPDFSHNVAWRFRIPSETAPSWLPRNQVTAFLGPSTHLVAYPLCEMESINIVAIASGISPGHTWDASASEPQREMLVAQFRHWNRQIVDLLKTIEKPGFWPLYAVGPGRWHNGKDIVLIGDAAHAMMPFAAQGSSMAIEDAYVLSNRVMNAPDIPQALAQYENSRKPRVAKVKARGQFNRFAYHARGPVRLARDLVLSMRPPQSLAADFDWLYGFDAD